MAKSDKDNGFAVLDRRGQDPAPKAPSAAPAAPTAAIPPGASPVRLACGFCNADLSANSYALDITLPAPGPEGAIIFQQQTLYMAPLICPVCQTPQRWQRSILTV